MTTQTKQAKRATHAAAPIRRRFTVDEYDHMVETGILRSGERVELLNGEILCMAAIGGRHSVLLTDLSWWFSRRLPESMRVRVQNPIRLPPDAEPEPDLTIVPYVPDAHVQQHPGPVEVLLLIELADTSLAYDSDTKLPLYAAAGIREIWLFDLTQNQPFVHRKPEGRRYADVQTVGQDGSIAPLAFPDLVLPLAEILR